MGQALVGVTNNPEAGFGKGQAQEIVQQNGRLDAQWKACPWELVQIGMAQSLMGDAQPKKKQHACRYHCCQEAGNQSRKGKRQGIENEVVKHLSRSQERSEEHTPELQPPIRN